MSEYSKIQCLHLLDKDLRRGALNHHEKCFVMSLKLWSQVIFKQS